MIKNKKPLFVKGEIIDAEMLELLRDNPLELFSLNYLDYQDGIISGIELSVSDKDIVIGKGIFKLNNNIFRISQNYHIEIPDECGDYLIKLKVKENGIINKKLEYQVEIVISERTSIEKGELYLATFKKQDGTYLRENERKFSEFDTEFNMMNIINQQFACSHSKGTLAPRIMKQFGKEILKKSCYDNLDVQFAFNCINNRMKRETILIYLASRNNKEYLEFNNEEIFFELKQILNFNGNKKISKERKKRISRILVD